MKFASARPLPRTKCNKYNQNIKKGKLQNQTLKYFSNRKHKKQIFLDKNVQTIKRVTATWIMRDEQKLNI